ncbi:hypothetical protein QRX60_44630 [Amycolatopsis mongoliensis]|uniref:Lipoprotein n=1 Tax=Amycolatopsis mongoliensis TaxID=715475 RepID=A0A9Y2NCU9_9PSEU|nr:hypothetical protein [Amycolatopsis sp. 4-36]WIY01051.1 hypothetical protein QRX60_44630 [Amycolatopsis sp. 4-36]
MKHLKTATAAAMLTVIAACSAKGGSDVKPTLTEQQAAERVESYIQSVLTVFPPATERKPDSHSRSECTDPTDNGPRGRFEISSGYQLLGLDPATFDDHFDAVVGWWKAHGFDIVTDHRPKDQYVFARNKTDSFDMSIEANDLGKVYIGATSPCVWPNGTPPAQAAAGSERDIPAAVPTTPPPAKSTRAPRRPRPDVEEEDYDHIDWTDAGPM